MWDGENERTIQLSVAATAVGFFHGGTTWCRVAMLCKAIDGEIAHGWAEDRPRFIPRYIWVWFANDVACVHVCCLRRLHRFHLAKDPRGQN